MNPLTALLTGDANGLALGLWIAYTIHRHHTHKTTTSTKHAAPTQNELALNAHLDQRDYEHSPRYLADRLTTAIEDTVGAGGQTLHYGLHRTLPDAATLKRQTPSAHRQART